MKYQFIKCLNPRHVTNIYNGEAILVECGKCESCLMKKSLARTTRCKLESAVHRFNIFATLTFSNDNLPLLELREVKPNGEFGTYDLVESDGNVLGTYTFKKHSDKMALIKKCGTPHNRIPYLKHDIIQKFVKRLRKYIYSRTNEKIRLFYCGELGPVHYRPHFHLLLWFDKDETLEIIHEAISSCWSFGRVDSQLSSGKSASYVSSYLNSSMYLPGIFKFRCTAPFSNHSFHLGESIFQDLAQEIQSQEFDRASRKRFFGNGINSDIVLWRSLKTKIIPKSKGYRIKSERERVLSYQLNAMLTKWTQEDSPTYQARFITDYVILNDFYSDDERFNEILQYFRYGTGYYMRHPDDTYRFVLPSITDWAKFQRSVYMQILTAKHFVERFCNGNVDLVPQRVKLMDDFYKYLDYENLKQQLDLEKQLSKTSDSHLCKYFFHNKLIIDELIEEPKFKAFSVSKRNMYKDFMKHKEQNDKNLIFNYI